MSVFTFRKSLLAVLVEAQNGECGLCRLRMDISRKAARREDPMRPTIDHLVPQAANGGWHGNVLAAHARCNTLKGSRYPSEDELAYLEIINARLGWSNPQRKFA